jgi:hypothetical protein
LRIRSEGGGCAIGVARPVRPLTGELSYGIRNVERPRSGMLLGRSGFFGCYGLSFFRVTTTVVLAVTHLL